MARARASTVECAVGVGKTVGELFGSLMIKRLWRAHSFLKELS